MASNPGGGNPAQGAGAGAIGGDGSLPGAVSVMDGGISDENRKVFIWVAELLDPNRREAALMELSKKREQVPELALVIWHSFGTGAHLATRPRDPGVLKAIVRSTRLANLFLNRRHDCSSSRDYLCVPPSESLPVDGRGFESGLQRAGASAMRCLSQ